MISKTNQIINKTKQSCFYNCLHFSNVSSKSWWLRVFNTLKLTVRKFKHMHKTHYLFDACFYKRSICVVMIFLHLFVYLLLYKSYLCLFSSLHICFFYILYSHSFTFYVCYVSFELPWCYTVRALLSFFGHQMASCFSVELEFTKEDNM